MAAVLSLGLFCLISRSAKANTEIHIFKNNATSLQLARPAGYIFYQQKSDSIRIQAPDFMRYRYTKHKTHKNPNLAFALAVFPGVCWHGVGHWYAGEENTAMAVFTTGCVGMFVMMIAMGDPTKSYDQMSEEEKKEDQRRRDQNVLIGGIIFLGSWVFDMVDAPLAAKRHNRKLSDEQNFIFKFELNQHNGFAGFRTYLLF